MVWGGGEVVQDGGIQDGGLGGIQDTVLRSDGVRVARKAGRRVAFVPRIRLLLRLLQFDRDWDCAVSARLPLVPLQLRMLALWRMRLVVWVCCVHQVQRCVACSA